MPNINDYLIWRGDIPIDRDPLNEVDALILTQIAYVAFDERAENDTGLPLREAAEGIGLPETTGDRFYCARRDICLDAAKSERFGALPVHAYATSLDLAAEKQFAAMTFSLPDGAQFLSFRGTDNTLVGWKEDFNMGFESPVPAQEEAVAYIARVAEKHAGALLLGGHSKGGNLALYAAAHAAPEIRARIEAVYSCDGPGLDEATVASEGYRELSGRVFSFLPQSSIIGMLMEYHEKYTVVQSDGVLIMQHDAFTWQVLGKRFVTLEEVDFSSKLLDQTVHKWLKGCTAEQRRVFVDAMYDVVTASQAQTLTEITAAKMRATRAMIGAMISMDAQTRKTLSRLIRQFISCGVENAWNMIRGKQDERAAETTDLIEENA